VHVHEDWEERKGRDEREIVKRGAPIAISTIQNPVSPRTKPHPIPHAMAYPNIPPPPSRSSPSFPRNPAQKKRRQKRPPSIPLSLAARPMKIKHKRRRSMTLSHFAHNASHPPHPPILIAQDERDMMVIAAR
jgi:hypothetical protein